MKKNRYPKQVNKLKTSLKITLGIAAFSATALILILILVFNFSKQEDSMAGSPMVFVGADTMQDTTSVYRGSTNQQAIGLVIQTSGQGNPLNITSVEFKAGISNGKISDNIENARLWFTGHDLEYACITQIGTTLPVIVDDKFTMDINKTLAPGKNYFWLTFDIKPGANSPAQFDVACTGIKIAAINYLPFQSSPAGSRFISNNLAYYSQGDLLINQTESWNSKRDGSGEPPKNLTNDKNVFFVQSGQNMQCVKGISMAAMTIEKGATLKSRAALKLKKMIIETGALYEQTATITDFYAFAEFEIANGGTYIHDNTGTIPGLNCNFKPHSNQKFTQYSQATFPTNVSWGNVIIDAATRINFDTQKNFRHVKGTMEFKRTGENNYLYCSTSDTMEIEGNLVFSGGNFTGVTGRSNILTILLKGDLIIHDGTLTDAQAVGTQQSHSILNIGGNVNFTGGTFDFAQAEDNASEINFTGGSINNVTWTQTGGEVLLGNVRVTANKELTINGTLFGVVSSSHSFIVESDASLLCGKAQLTGAGRFVLEDNATIGIGHAAGINSAGQEGNIITGKRIFNSGANYMYYADMSPQKTGKFVTEPWAGTIRNLTIRKDASSQWVILSQDFLVSDNISILQGIIEKNSRRLLKSDVSQNGGQKEEGWNVNKSMTNTNQTEEGWVPAKSPNDNRK